MTIWQQLTRRRGNMAWNGVVRASAVLAVIGIVVTLLGSDEAGGLVGFTTIEGSFAASPGMLSPRSSTLTCTPKSMPTGMGNVGPGATFAIQGM